MQQLHLVGVTTDHDALIFSARKGAKSGGFLVALDDKFYDTIDEAGRLRDGEGDGSSSRRKGRRPSIPRPESALSPRDIQTRLRAGRSIAHVASEAGVDEEWVMRFAAPILAEQALVIAKALGMTFAKARLGLSGRPLGESVWWNVADKGALMAEDTFDQCWTAVHLRDSAWIVRFEFINRKKRQRAEWELDTRDGTLVARNRLGSELGYVEPGRRGRPPVPLPAAAKPVVKKAAAPAPRRPAKRTAVKRALAKRAPAKKRAVKKPAKKRGAAKKTAVRRPAPKRAAAKRPATKKTAVRRPAPKRAAAKRPAAKRPAAKKTAAKRPVAKRPAAKRAARPRPRKGLAPAEASFDTPSFDTGEATRPVTIRAPRAGEPEPVVEAEPVEAAPVEAAPVEEPGPLPPPPVLTSTPQPGLPRPTASQSRFSRLRRRRPPGS